MAQVTKVGRKGTKPAAVMAALQELGQATARELGRRAGIDANRAADLLKRQPGATMVSERGGADGVWRFVDPDMMTTSD